MRAKSCLLTLNRHTPTSLMLICQNFICMHADYTDRLLELNLTDRSLLTSSLQKFFLKKKKKSLSPTLELRTNPYIHM